MRMSDLRAQIIELNKRPVGFFGKDWGVGRVKLFVVLSDDIVPEPRKSY